MTNYNGKTGYSRKGALEGLLTAAPSGTPCAIIFFLAWERAEGNGWFDRWDKITRECFDPRTIRDLVDRTQGEDKSYFPSLKNRKLLLSSKICNTFRVSSASIEYK